MWHEGSSFAWHGTIPYAYIGSCLNVKVGTLTFTICYHVLWCAHLITDARHSLSRSTTAKNPKQILLQCFGRGQCIILVQVFFSTHSWNLKCLLCIMAPACTEMHNALNGIPWWTLTVLLGPRLSVGPTNCASGSEGCPLLYFCLTPERMFYEFFLLPEWVIQISTSSLKQTYLHGHLKDHRYPCSKGRA